MRLFKQLGKPSERGRKKQALSYLQSMTTRQLIDCGFSPELVALGMEGYPWIDEDIGAESAIACENDLKRVVDAA